MKRFFILLLFFICTSLCLHAQNLSWLYGTWYGETYFPNGPVTKRIITRLRVTSVNGAAFSAQLANLFPNDTTVRLARTVTGKIANRQMLFTSFEETYIRDPRTRNIWPDCTGCPTQTSFSLNENNVVIKLSTSNCGDICDGETTFSRDTSSFDSTAKRQLARWFSLPVNSTLARKRNKGKDTASATTKPVAVSAVKKDTVFKALLVKKDSAVPPVVAIKKEAPALPAVKIKPPKQVVVTPPVADKKDTMPSALTTRTTNLVNTFAVTSPHITIQLFDKAEIDGDMVSVFHNGKLIVDHQTLTHKAIVINIDVSAANPHHEFVMVAENLGLTPPNTALLRILAGAQKFELEVSSDFDNNAKIAIDYTGP